MSFNTTTNTGDDWGGELTDIRLAEPDMVSAAIVPVACRMYQRGVAMPGTEEVVVQRKVPWIVRDLQSFIATGDLDGAYVYLFDPERPDMGAHAIGPTLAQFVSHLVAMHDKRFPQRSVPYIAPGEVQQISAFDVDPTDLLAPITSARRKRPKAPAADEIRQLSLIG
jgi:hypothetical protein